MTLDLGIGNLAGKSSLRVVSIESGTDFSGSATTRFELGLDGVEKTWWLELPDTFPAVLSENPKLISALGEYFADLAKRLRNPKPHLFVTLRGLPLTFENFQWPFHRSVSGADSLVVHGSVGLGDSQLHTNVAASLTVTFAEILLAPQQPYAESVVFNAVLKTFDQGQLELVKSGNRQPVTLTTRFYSYRRNRFIFAETTEDQVKEFLDTKLFWQCSAGTETVWIADPFDAQYLDTDVVALKRVAAILASEGSLALDDTGEFATPTAALMGEATHYGARKDDALAALKPKFNEEMRAGHTNM